MIAFLVGLSACKKDNTAESEQPVSPTTGSRIEFTLDSIYLYAKQIYLWNGALPSYTVFNPRKYTTLPSGAEAGNQELFDITQLENNPATGIPYESPVYAGTPKYSYITTQTGSGTVAAVVGSNQAAVLQTALLNSGTRKVGYIALGSFPELSTCKTALDNAFVTLTAANPSYLVIDLRSNGGGYVETAQYVANLVAPTSLNGKVMYTEQYNSLLQSGKATILKHQPYLDDDGKNVMYNGRNATMADVDFTASGNTFHFSKKGTLESVTAVYFIVSSNTASASELLISSLKPYFKVKLVGATTYGKPVGFFAVHIDTYTLYLSSFLIQNASGWSDYFNGIPADIQVAGTSNPTLGDPTENCLNAALADINNTSTNLTSKGKLLSVKSDRQTALSNVTLTNPIIETRFKLKK